MPQNNVLLKLTIFQCDTAGGKQQWTEEIAQVERAFFHGALAKSTGFVQFVIGWFPKMFASFGFVSRVLSFEMPKRVRICPAFLTILVQIRRVSIENC